MPDEKQCSAGEERKEGEVTEESKSFANRKKRRRSSVLHDMFDGRTASNRLWTATVPCAEMSSAIDGRFVLMGRWLTLLALAMAPIALAQSPSVQLWTSATSGITYKITTGVHRLEAEKLCPPAFQAQVDEGAFVRCEYSQQGDAWVGKCRSRLPFADSKNRAKWCNFKFTSRITALTPTRIEGESEVWETEDVDVGKCEIKKSHMQHFVWFPKS